jgi:chromosome segregation ATPase
MQHMSDMNANQPNNGGLKIPILFGSVLALLGSNVYQYVQLDKVRKDIAGIQSATGSEIEKLKEGANVTLQTYRRNQDALRAEMETARRQAAMATGAAREEANKRVLALQGRLAEETAKTKEQLTQTIDTKTKEVATMAESRIGEVKTDVGNVKTEVDKTKQELDNTIATLKSARGDLDNHSSLIATNAKELGALRALGERNYFEFRLNKTKDAVRVGDVMLKLKKADVKKNRYNVEVTADDKTVEKKDKNTNEPVQFYTSRARQPYELVVNEVRKDEIVGYVSTPKVQAAR